jgi:hypothetical protein
MKRCCDERYGNRKKSDKMVIKDERNCRLLATICELLHKQGYNVSGCKGTVSDPTGQGMYQMDLEITFNERYKEDFFQNLPKDFFLYRYTLAYQLKLDAKNKANAEHSLKLAMQRLHGWIKKNEGWSAVYLLSGML